MAALLAALMLVAALSPCALADWLRINKGVQDETGINFFINLLDDSGNSVGSGTNFPADSYDVWHGDTQFKPDGVNTLENAGRGTHYYVCVDVSGSVTKQEMKEIQESLGQFFIGINPSAISQNKASLWQFGEKVTELVTGTSDSAQLVEAAKKLPRNEKYTHLFEVINRAVTQARSRADVDNTVIIIITDGEDDQGKNVYYTYNAIAQTVQQSGVPMYGIMLPIKKNRDPNTTELRQLCEMSGGRLFQMNGSVSGELPYILNQIRDIADSTAVVHIPVCNDGTLTHPNENFSITLVNGGQVMESDGEYTVMNLAAGAWPSPSPTPEPTPSPTPTITPSPEPRTTPPVVAEVTTEPPVEEEPVFVDATPEPSGLGAWLKARFGGENLKRNWWMLAAAVLLLAGIVILLVVLIGGASRKKAKETIKPTDGTVAALGDLSESKTVRAGRVPGPVALDGDDDDLGGTVRSSVRGRRNPDYDYDAPREPYGGTMAVSNGTVNVGGPSSDPFTPVQPGDYNPFEVGGGTVRMDEPGFDLGYGGTVRMDEPEPGIELRIVESRDSEGYSDVRTVRLVDALTVGRVAPANVVIDDRNVSSRHLRIAREGGGVTLTDTHSTNGTRLNGVKIETNAPQALHSGDTVVIGRTTLEITFDE